MTASERQALRTLSEQLDARSPAGPAPRRAAHPDAPPTAPTPRRARRDPDAPRPVRLFVALDLPGSVVDALAALGAAADQAVWRPVAPEALHVTLAFLGSRPPDDVAAIAPIVAAERQAPPLALRDVLLLPPRRARVLTVGLDDPSGALGDLQARVAAKLAGAGLYTPEARPFRPHVTVARLRPRARSPRSAEARIDALEFSASALTLYASRLHPTGARYEALARATLG